MTSRALSLIVVVAISAGSLGQVSWAQDLTAAAIAPDVTPAVPSADDVEKITTVIIGKELELQKLNTNLKLHQLPKPWARRRWAFINLANVSLTATGAFINGIGRYQYLRDPARAPKALFEHAAWCRVTANMLAVGGAMFETSMLVLGNQIDRGHGFDLPTMRKYADRLQNDIDSLLSQRATALASANVQPDERQILDSEGLILKDIRNLTVNEFARFYSDSKGSRVQTYLGYFIAGTSNAIAGSGGITGNAAAALKHHTVHYKIRLGGYGGIADIIAGSLNQSVPFVTRLGGAIERKYARQSICQQLDCQEPAQLDAFHDHQQQFHQLVTTSPQLSVSSAVLKDSIFDKQAAIFDEHEKLRIGDRRAARRSLVDQLIFFSGIGGPKLTNGVGITVAAYKYTNDAKKRFRAIGGPAIAYGAGYCVAAAELLRFQTLTEIRSYKQNKAGTSQGQVLKKEIGQLEALETDLNRQVMHQ